MLSPTIERINKHLKLLVGERNPYSSPERLVAAGDYISKHFQNYNFTVREEKVVFDTIESKNIIAFKSGAHKEMFVVGAHYDSVQNSPGADDNASAVAALLEIARCLEPETLKYSIAFCGFALEEYGCVGSRQFVKNLGYKKEKILGMISLEMLGFSDGEEGSQTYPHYVDPTRYPDRGDFIAVIGNENSAELTLATKEGMRKTVPFLPVEHLIVPGRGNEFQDVRLSDHSPFWDEGHRAVMITDTAFFRNPNYHQPTDTLDTLNFDFLKNVTTAISGFLKFYLC